jgi:nucleoside-diphosphate-sugar epimerase
MSNSRPTVLIAGASGFVGGAAVERFAADGAAVIGLSRRAPATRITGVVHLPLDLRDASACRAMAPALAPVTHLVYAAVNETPGDLVASWKDPEHAARNGAMFVNLLGMFERSGSALEHVTLVHGTKAYATHRPEVHAPVPLRESLPRPDNDDFYFRQEDALFARAKRRGWHWTIFRAPMIAGGGAGSNLNALLAIAVFAALRRDEGLGLPFPGAGPSLGVMEMVDVELLARAIAWSGRAETAADQIFNVANGDVFAWPDLWPLIAEEMGVAADAPQPMSVRSYLDDAADRWRLLARRHRLKASEDIGFLGESGSLADFALGNCARTILTSTIKLRQAGFGDCIDTAASVVGWIRRWRAEGLLPPR